MVGSSEEEAPPAVENTVVEKTPVVEETHVVEEKPVLKDTPVVEETPVVEDIPAVEDKLADTPGGGSDTASPVPEEEQVPVKKLSKKEQKKAEKAAEKSAENGQLQQNDWGDVDISGLIGISSIGMPPSGAAVPSKKGKEKSMEVDEDEDAPILINSEYKDMRSVLDKVDVILHVLDAREPLASCSEHLQEYASEKGEGRVVFILNKIGVFACSGNLL